MPAVEADAETRCRFDAMCTEYSTDLFRFLYWLCHDRALAEDVMQEVWLRAWRSFDSLHDRNAARPWLLTIARRELARVFERKRLNTVDIDELSDADQDLLAVADSYDVDEMRVAILQLDPDYREPLVLQVLFGYSCEEVAEQLELSVPAVLTRLFRARQFLRRRLSAAAGTVESLS